MATKLPFNHFNATGRPVPEAEQTVIGLDKNCYQCSDPHTNEATLKAFKIACLSYEPSKVNFEKTTYSRNELIQSKQVLMRYCLDQLRHLDLTSIDSIV